MQECNDRVLAEISQNTVTQNKAAKNCCHLAGHIFRWILMCENIRILIQISLKFVPKDTIDQKPPLIQIIDDV